MARTERLRGFHQGSETGGGGAGAAQARFDRFEPADLARGGWTGPWVEAGLPVADLVVSWNLVLPPGALLDVEAQIRRGGDESRWYSLGRWAEGVDARRTSVEGQRDRDAEVRVDTLVVRGAPASGYRLRLALHGAAGTGCVPSLVGAMASSPAAVDAAPSAPRGAPIELDVPALSQQLHRGTYAHLDGGGASWCSPTALAMVLAFWGAGPTAAELAGLGEASPDLRVAHAALSVFDHAYGGAGNWSFNVAYAGRYGLEAFVTRLGSLREAELLLAAGIPLVLSVAAGPGELDGFPLRKGTRGHLLVLAGVSADGDVVVNDPAAPSNAEVRRAYRRHELERAWLAGSGGSAYLIHPARVPLPAGCRKW